MAKKRTHWSFGGGMTGCLYDCGPDYAETKTGALAALTQIYDLTEEEVATLKSDCILYFSSDRAQEVGAEYCELNEQDGPIPDDEEG